MEASGPNITPAHLRLVSTYAPAQRPPNPAAPAQRDSDLVDLSDAARATPRAAVRRLIAAKVQGPITFDAGPASSESDAVPLYSHPADTNAAATGIALGRKLDLSA